MTKVTEQGPGGQYLVVIEGQPTAVTYSDGEASLFCGRCSGAGSQAAYARGENDKVPMVVTDCEHVALVKQHLQERA